MNTSSRKRRKPRCPACKKPIHTLRRAGDILEHTCGAVLQVVEDPETGRPKIRRFKPMKFKEV